MQPKFRNGELYKSLADAIVGGHGQWVANSTCAVKPVALLTHDDMALLVFGRGMKPSYITGREWNAARELAAEMVAR